jgi:hypothetical protein
VGVHKVEEAVLIRLDIAIIRDVWCPFYCYYYKV